MPTAENRPPVDIREQLKQLGYHPVGALRFTDTIGFINQNKTGEMWIDMLHPVWDVNYGQQVLANLPSDTCVDFSHLPSTSIDIQQMQLKGPVIHWHERSIGADELEITFQTTQGTTLKPDSITFTEQEFMDLFLRKNDPKSSFFIAETSEQQIIGIVLKRAKPTLLFLSPGNDNQGLSPNGGLRESLDQIYTSLTSRRMTSLQTQVDDKVFQASLAANGQVVIESDGTPSGVRKKEIYKRLYQIQAILLAHQAEGNGGIDNDDLVRHAPFLKVKDGKKTTTGFFKFGAKKTNSDPSVTITASIWTNLITPFKGTMLPEIKTQSAAEKTQEQPVFKITSTPVAQPTQIEHAKVISEKQQSIRAARELSYGLQELAVQFRGDSPEEINLKTITTFSQKLDRLIAHAENFLQDKKRLPPDPNAKTYPIAYRNGAINVGGLKNDDVYDFLSDGQPQDYKVKIEKAFEAWQQNVIPLYLKTESRKERTLGGILASANLAQDSQLISRVIQATETCFKSNGQQLTPETNVADTIYLITCSQIVFALNEHFEQLKAHGSNEDITRWGFYTNSTLSRLRGLATQLKGMIPS